MQIQCKRACGDIYGDAHEHPLLTSEQLAIIAGTHKINWAELQQPISLGVIYQPGVMPTQHVQILDGFHAKSYHGIITSVHHQLTQGQNKKLTTKIKVKT